MKIESFINSGALNQKTASSPSAELGESFSKFLADVNDKQTNSNQKIAELATGSNQDIPQAMIALEKADISIKLLLAVRNKLLSAYQEISRMPV